MEKNALGGRSIDSIRYPDCKHRIDNPAELLETYPQLARWTCPECGNQGLFGQINWRKSAGFAHYFIEVSNIFPKEAVPSPGILQSLKTCTRQDWSWFYSKSSQF
jgi:ssDNA-binding Zn-finger/Zn-ribbon topoisomerase 1